MVPDAQPLPPRRAYLKRLNAALAAEERTEVSERTPWWTTDRKVEPATGRPYVVELGRGTGLPGERIEGRLFLDLASQALGITIDTLSSTRKDRETTRLRQLSAMIGIERWGQRAGLLRPLLGKHPDVVSRWVSMGAERRCTDEDFAEAADNLDRRVFELSSSKGSP